MSNKIVDKRDLVLNQAKEILLNMLKDHADNEFCAYAYLELTLGADIEEYRIDYIKDKILTLDGTFKAKENKRSGKIEQYSMDDLLNCLIHFLSGSLRDRALKGRKEEIKEKYGAIVYLEGIGCCLKKTLLGTETKYFDKHHSVIEKMIKEYILGV